MITHDNCIISCVQGQGVFPVVTEAFHFSSMYPQGQQMRRISVYQGQTLWACGCTQTGLL